MSTPKHGATAFNRRDALQFGATGLAALGGLALVRPVRAGPGCTLPPAQTEGPYWVDERLNRADIRPDPDSGIPQAGLPMRLAINVSEITAGACGPFAGAYVDLWHCNALGVYSDVAAQGTIGQRWLRGYQVTDGHGNVRFITIYPGWYQGRTVHIHFRVRRFAGAQVTFNFVSQLYFDDSITTAIFQRAAPYSSRPNRSTTNAQDGIYRQGGAQLTLRLADNNTHVVASFNVVINSNPGLADARATPIDLDAQDHLHDFGGGTPPLA